MKFLSLFSGIGAPECAWGPLGWQCVASCEIELKARCILRERFTEVPRIYDVTKITEKTLAQLGNFDLIVAGSPCQDISTIGKRKGLVNGEKSSLYFEALRIFKLAQEINHCRFFLWENVAGVLDSNEGRDFARVIETMVGVSLKNPPRRWGNAGYCAGPGGMFEWVLLDACAFGLAQRRRRIFAFIDSGDWRSRQPVFADKATVQGSPRKDAKDEKEKRASGAKSLSGGGEAKTGSLCAWGISGTGDVLRGRIGTLLTQNKELVVFTTDEGGTSRVEDIREITPLERERLQGFPDNWTQTTPPTLRDAERNFMLGNSMAVPVMRWIGERINDAFPELAKSEIKPVRKSESSRLLEPYYQDDYVTLYCGDSLKIMPLLKTESVDLVLTDPPYGIKYRSYSKRINHKPIVNDAGLEWLSTTVEQWSRLLKDRGHLYCFSGWTQMDVFKQTIEKSLRLKKFLTWNKLSPAGKGNWDSFRTQSEYIFFAYKGKFRGLNFTQRPTDILECNRVSWRGVNRWHPTPKPLPLVERLVGYSAGGLEKPLVLDPFAGSGVVGVACKELKIPCVLIELDRDYCQHIAERLQKCDETKIYAKREIKEPIAFDHIGGNLTRQSKIEQNKMKLAAEMLAMLEHVEEELRS